MKCKYESKNDWLFLDNHRDKNVYCPFCGESLNDNIFTDGGYGDSMNGGAVSNKDISCFDCRYYQGEQYVCMKLYRTKCIRDEQETAQKCSDFVEGDYNEDLIEKEYWDEL